MAKNKLENRSPVQRKVDSLNFSRISPAVRAIIASVALSATAVVGGCGIEEKKVCIGTDVAPEPFLGTFQLKEIYEKYEAVFNVVQEHNCTFNRVNLSQLTIDFIDEYLREGTASIPNEYYGQAPDFFITHEEAGRYYARLVAHNIVLDYTQTLPWSLDDLSSDAMRAMFEPAGYFEKFGDDFRILNFIPSDPVQIYGFLKERGLIKETREKTIYALIDWMRTTFSHRTSDHNATPTDKPPKTSADILMKSNTGAIYIQGCVGTAFIIENITSSVGIPARIKFIQLDGAKHSRVEFFSEKKTSLHADDLYSFRRSFSGAEIPAEVMLIPSRPLNGEQGKTEDVHYFDLINRYLPSHALLDRAEDLNDLHESPRFKDPRPILGEQAGEALLAKMDQAIQNIGDGNMQNAIDFLDRDIIWPE